MPRLLDNVTCAVRPWADPPVTKFRVWCYSPLIARVNVGQPVWSPADFPTVGEANECAKQLARSEWAPGIRCKVYVEVVTDEQEHTSKLASDRMDQSSRSRRFAPSAPNNEVQVNLKQQANATRLHEVLARQTMERGVGLVRLRYKEVRPAFETYCREVDKQVNQLNILLKDRNKRLRAILLKLNALKEHGAISYEFTAEIRKLASLKRRRKITNLWRGVLP